ncbi:MAG: 3-methyl-2-oxobutanoate hydroxymethyltransferase [Pirellulaceae bacterium]|nr:MAG: 3-methyl-2-oxobutanoate hydroxymethyltransferase [Pirellulaceae bacterium]
MTAIQQVTVQTLQDMKQAGEKIAMLTAYDYYTAQTLDQAGVDILLVGDTVGMAVAGHPTTIPVRLEHIIYHAEMVSRAVKRAMVVGDLPFLTYQVTIESAVQNAGRLMQDGKVHAVKLEGGRSMVPFIKHILRAGIPVMGHLGLTPQSVYRFGGFRVQGRDALSATKVREAALALQDAGCFAIVLEAIPADLAREVTQSLRIPTIGIGAGPHCDGQVLVTPDMLGMTGFSAKYIKHYANLKQVVHDAVSQYVREVKSGEYPTEKHAY